MIHSSGVVPVPEIYNDTNRRTSSITEIGDTIMSNVRCIRAATPFEWSHVHLRPCRFIDDRRKRMFAEIVMELSPRPLPGIGSLEGSHFLIGGGKSRQTQVIALLRRIPCESGFWIFQSVQQSRCVRKFKRVRCRLAEHGLLEGPAEMTAEPDLIQGCLR